METPKTKPVPLKKIVPIKGSLLQKLKNELKNCNSSSNNIVIDSINNNSAKINSKSEPESQKKIIIQKVENVNYKLSDICPIAQNDQNENKMVNQVKNFSNVNTPGKSPIKLLSAEMPENEKNVTVPLRLIRTVRTPKVRPQLLKRFHKIQVDTSDPPNNSVDKSQQKIEILNDLMNPPRDIKAPSQETESLSISEELQPEMLPEEDGDFLGFPPSTGSEIDAGRWKEIIMEEKYLLTALEIPAPVPTTSLQKNVTRRIISKVSKQFILDKLKMKNSPQKLKDCKPKEDISTNNQQCLSKFNELPNVPELHMSHLVTSTPLIIHKRERLISESVPTLSQSSVTNGDMPWQDDIFSVIGLKRIEEIDENLKEIPNLVTGNAIETENVEFKLIINHMKKLLGVNSIKQTLNLKPKSPSNIIEESAMVEREENAIDDNDDTTGDESNPDFEDDSRSLSSYENELTKRQEEHDTFGTSALSNEKPCDETIAEDENDLEILENNDNTISKEEASFGNYIENVDLENTENSFKTVENNDNISEEEASVENYIENVDLENTENSFKTVENNDNIISKEETSVENYTENVDLADTGTIMEQTDEIEFGSNYDEYEEEKFADHSQNSFNPETDKESDGICEEEISDNICETPETPMEVETTLPNMSPDQQNRLTIKATAISPTKDIQKQTEHEKTDTDSDVPIMQSKRRRIVESDSDHSETVNTYMKLAITPNIPEMNTLTDEIPNSNIEHNRRDKKKSESSRRKGKRGRERSSLKVKNETKKSCMKQKKQTKTKSPTQTTVLSGKRGRKKADEIVVTVQKKVFQQSVIEKAVESKVQYDAIILSIHTSRTEARKGRKLKTAGDPFEDERKQLKEKLKSLKVFKCGSCSFNVTKHRWREHVMEHGGLCWIDDFEAPYDFNDWNECLRRMIHTFKVYNIDSMTCPHCNAVRKSALGHMSHAAVCGESDEVVDQRKQTCELCNEKVLPFMVSFHRKTCSAMLKVQKYVAAPEEIPADQNLTVESFSVTGRLKRQAVRKAETSFKKIAKTLNDVDDYIAVAGKIFTCAICSSKFNTKDVLVGHIRKEHNPNEEGDFDHSESEAEIRENESSESDGSSGCESSEIETDVDFDLNDNDENRSHRKGKEGHNDPEEVKHGKSLVGDFNIKKFSHFTVDQTQEIFETFWHKQVLRNLMSSHIISKDDVKKTMKSMQFPIKSKEFSHCLVNSYSSKFFEHSSKISSQLEICQPKLEDECITMYCGGTISSIDWAPVTCESEFDFLAVACNKSEEFTVNLEKTSISVIQIYQFRGLRGESPKDCKLSYIFSVGEGPIWSIKFHPNHSSLENRIGLLAVTTANQNILIFTLPFLKESNSHSLLIEPCLTCKLDMNDLLVMDQYLYQATRVNWFVNRYGKSYLCAGYVNGLLVIWEINNKDKISLPMHTIQAHQEFISSLDTRPSGEDSFQILTSSHDRRVNTFVVQDNFIRETSSFLSLSRVSAAEWWINWPGFIMGHDDCYGTSRIIHRQPLEFAGRNQIILQQPFPIKSFSINHWNNTVLAVTGSGEVLSFRPTCGIMREMTIKNNWSQFNFDIESFTDIRMSESGEEIGLVFCDLKKQVTSPPNSFRTPPVDRINDLMINHVCFNRNEKRHHFYALGYETGFIRIKNLKNSK